MNIDTVCGGFLREAAACDGVPAIIQLSLGAELPFVEAFRADDAGGTVWLLDDNLRSDVRCVVRKIDVATHGLQPDGFLLREVAGIIPCTLRHIPDVASIHFYGAERTDEVVVAGIALHVFCLHLLQFHILKGHLLEIGRCAFQLTNVNDEGCSGGNDTAYHLFEVNITVGIVLDQHVYHV